MGKRTSVVALVAAALEPEAVAGVSLRQPLGSLKEVIERNRTVMQMPELFCFALLEHFDIKQLAALVAPRPVEVIKPSKRARAEWAGLDAWSALLAEEIKPVKIIIEEMVAEAEEIIKTNNRRISCG